MQKNLPSCLVNQMVALESVGLVKNENMNVPGTGFNQGITLKIKRYTLNDAEQNPTYMKKAACAGAKGY
ncbi:hypothetical protein ABW387_07850 [Snodgrassella alvi]|uniref:hypothetical protein n=1 Tax=Snodgrassella alvi TaxID=1196083 RepID=UPI003512EE9D